MALDGVSLTIRSGELFGLLGPNGAGKTTLIKILSTLLAPSSGRAFVGGVDVMEDPNAIRRIMNMVSGGENSGYGLLTVRENLWMFSQFYGIPTQSALPWIDELLHRLDFWEERNTKINKLSTGMRQKMNFIRGFINHPRILFLDEPTLGLDVTASRSIRGFVKEWVGGEGGRTVLLTTHYMAEADELCDRIAIIDSGRILACDTPDNLKRRIGRNSVLRIVTSPARDIAPALQDAPGVLRCAGNLKPESDSAEFTLMIEDDSALSQAVHVIEDAGSTIISLAKDEPSLEDVFIELVGRRLADNEHAQG